ncbi:MAG: cell division protein ZipA C-terminal FtsZ-binding domain-containing protein [Gammaproteobacteria bacterium]|jgi:cell division protein ZipA
MTSGELRLLILVLGLLFIAAVYLWERHKRTQKEIRKKREYAEAFDDPDVLGEQINELDMLVTQREKSIPYIQASDPEFEGIVSLEPEPSVVLDDHPGVSPGETAARAQRSDAILIISIASNKKFFSGDAIMSSLRALNLVPGPMDVFYRYDETQESILYTVASMVEPGTFPVDDMSRYMTSGLTLFGRLPAARPGSEIFSDMVESAQQLAAQLDGKLLDSQHQPMTEEKLDEMRQLAESYPAKQA